MLDKFIKIYDAFLWVLGLITSWSVLVIFFMVQAGKAELSINTPIFSVGEKVTNDCNLGTSK